MGNKCDYIGIKILNPTVNYRFWWLLFFHVGSPNITLGAGHWLQRRLHVVGADGMWETSVCWALLLSCVWLFVTPQTVAHQAPLSMRILQAGILEWVAMLSSRDLLNPRIEPRSPALQAHSLPFELPEKSKNIGVGSLSLLQGIFPTQESNRSLLHCRRILYQLSYQGSPSSAGREQCLNSHTEWLGR